MIIINTRCKVFDNSGVLVLSCISLTKNVSKKGASLMDVFIGSAKYLNLKKKKNKFTKGSICIALVIKISRNFLRKWGHFYLKSDFNGVVLMNSEGTPIAKRFFSFVFNEFRFKFIKVALLALFLI